MTDEIDELDPVLREAADEFFRAGDDGDADGEPGGETPAEETDTGEAQPPVEETAEPPAEPPSAADIFTYDDGLTLSKDDARELAQFQAYLAQNPQVVEKITQVLNEAAQPQTLVAPPEAPAETPDLDEYLDDPAYKRLHDLYLKQQDTIAGLQSQVQQHDTYVSTTQMAQVDSLLQRARVSYQKEHDLSDNEMQSVFDTAGRLQVLPSLLSPVDPKTGLPRRVDPLTAIEESFDTALWQIPELRERQIEARMQEQRGNTVRKGKLSSLSGGGQSAPRQPAEPKNESERRAAMIADVAGYLRGEGAN